MGIFFNYNGNIYNEGTPVISPGNRSLKYGDGLFETMKLVKGKIICKDYHFERLFNGIKILEFDLPLHFTLAYFEKEITELANKNGNSASAKIRLMIFRGKGGLYDAENHFPNYIIETWPTPGDIKLNEQGISADIYPYTKKGCDILSNLKTNNFLPYVLAAIYAKKNKLDDCILLNSHNRICETTVANIFLIKNDLIYTPSLSEGCIAGVMRRWFVENIKMFGNNIREKEIAVEELMQADEIFITNSLHPITWVKRFQNIEYSNERIKHLFTSLQQLF